MKPRLGCIADDYTGATDLASMLVRAGLETIQLFGGDTPESVLDLAQVIPGKVDHVATETHHETQHSLLGHSINQTIGDDLDQADAIVIALKSRSNPVEEAVAMSRTALEILEALGAERFFFKYCSTFDSTEQGNIGPVAEYLADKLESHQVIFCPAFPENGRTVYRGHLFVGDQLLHESSMRNHPLNPMRDSNLVRVLQTQTQRPVHRLERNTFNADEPRFYIADATNESDLQTVAEAAKDARLLTGGSPIARYWAEQLLRDATLHRTSRTEASEAGCFSSIHSQGYDRSVVLVGSCSQATRRQLAESEKSFPVFVWSFDDFPTTARELDSDAAKNWIETTVERTFAWCRQRWSAGHQSVAIASNRDERNVQIARELLGEHSAAKLTEILFGTVARRFVRDGVRNLVVAGGETSGAIVNALGIRSIRIGQEIAPGVPEVFTRHLIPHDNPNQPFSLRLVLKSGNFGNDDFFRNAIQRHSIALNSTNATKN